MIETSSDLPRNLRYVLEIFGKCLETFMWPSHNFWRILANFRKVVRNLQKIVKSVISLCLYNYKQKNIWLK